jgi:hypothetical protein
MTPTTEPYITATEQPPIVAHLPTFAEWRITSEVLDYREAMFAERPHAAELPPFGASQDFWP